MSDPNYKRLCVSTDCALAEHAAFAQSRVLLVEPDPERLLRWRDRSSDPITNLDPAVTEA